MKVKLLDTGEAAVFNDEYAARLIEQGKAVPVFEEQKSEKKAADKPVKKPAATK